MRDRTDGEAGKGPHLLRQDHIRQALELAFEQECGLYPVMSPTGSGKNHVARNLIADKIAAMVEGNAAGIGPSGRGLVVVSIPGKDNRDDFASEIKEALRDRLPDSSEHELSRLVVAIPKLTDGFDGYYEANKAGDVIPGCPFVFQFDPAGCSKKNESERKAAERDVEGLGSLIERKWRELCHACEKRSRYYKLEPELAREWLRKEEEAERALRGAVKKGLANPSATPEGPLFFPAIREIWPGSLINLGGPQVIVVTPQRFRLSIDTVLGKTVALDSPEVAAAAVYVFDELDHQKSDMLQAMIESAPSKFQPDEVVRSLHEAVHAKCNPLFRASPPHGAPSSRSPPKTARPARRPASFGLRPTGGPRRWPKAMTT